MTKNESINYSNYEPNETIQIKKYISEEKRGLIYTIAGAKSGEKHLLISPTESGKTYTVINLLKKFNTKSIFIVPNASNVEQIMEEYNIPGAYGDLGSEEQLEKSNIVAMTWDKFSQLKDVDLTEYIAVVDEIHQTFIDMFRENKIRGLYENLEKCKGRIDITATPNKLDFSIYDYIVEYEQQIQTKYNVKLYPKLNDKLIVDIINNSNKAALFRDDKNYLEYINATINKKSEIITSDLKDSEAYLNIVNNSNIANIEVLLNTSVIVAGVNIKEPNITDIIVIGTKDIATIKQYVARFRGLKEVNVHIFNTSYNEDMSNTYQIEWRLKQYIREFKEYVDKFNKFNNAIFKPQTKVIKPFKLENSIEYYYDDESREYKINIQGIRNKLYMEYYRKADILSFKELLMEYYENIEVVQIEEQSNEDRKSFNKYLKQAKQETLEVLELDKKILVGISEIIKGKTNYRLDNYFTENRLSKDKILEQINNKNIPELLKVSGIKKTIDLYSKYIVENRFTYELAWYIANKGNRARGKIFNQINIQAYREIEKKYPHIIDNNIIENRLYNLITREFVPGVSYTKEHIEIFIEGLKIHLPGLKISELEIREKLQNIYVVEVKQNKKVPGLGYNFYKNMIPNGGTKKVNIYTIKRYKKIADIIEEHQLSETSGKCLKKIIDKKINNILNDSEAQELITISNIFIS